MRGAADAIDVTYGEAQALGRQFATLSGLSRDQAESLAGEVRVTGGFARAYGLEPSRANAFFAQARGVGLTNTTDDTRRLALMIGEAVARSGVFSKADEISAHPSGSDFDDAAAALPPKRRGW